MAKREKIKLPCHFGQFSLGKDKARIGVKFPRTGDSKISPTQAVHLFAGSQLEVKLIGEDDSQPNLPGIVPDNLGAVVECHRCSISSDTITASLTFEKTTVKIGELASFAQCSGKIEMSRIGDANGAGEEEDEAAEEDKE